MAVFAYFLGVPAVPHTAGTVPVCSVTFIPLKENGFVYLFRLSSQKDKPTFVGFLLVKKTV